MAIVFDWDENKARQNIKKHGISFDEAASVFGDPFSLTMDDPLHSNNDDRYVTIGLSTSSHLLVVVHTERGDHIRIISSRLATSRERKDYEKNNEIRR